MSDARETASIQLNHGVFVICIISKNFGFISEKNHIDKSLILNIINKFLLVLVSVKNYRKLFYN